MQELDFLRSVRLIPAHAGKTLLSTGLPCRWRAHPRSRGENGSSTCWKPYHVGSSPLTQGKPPTSLPRGATRRAHPRSRGENDVYPQAERSVTGSSPLTQGKRLNRQSTELVRGFIPAHAGKTSRSRPPRGSRAAHPHSRGENGTALTAAINPTGSSPLTRGKHGARGGRGPGNGLIPAHAGKTVPCAWTRCGPGAHPRSRGGNQGRRDHQLPVLRLNPTDSGKTKSAQSQQSASWAHPHSREENCTRAAKLPVITGSSPITRGKHHGTDSRRPRRRLIPTHARKTRYCS